MASFERLFSEDSVTLQGGLLSNKNMEVTRILDNSCELAKWGVPRGVPMIGFG